MKQNARLDAVTKTKTAYVMARATLEARLREQMANELSNLQTQIDIAVRYAFDSGESKASILRALGTKDYGTLNASLDRTNAVTELIGESWLDEVYTIMDGGKYLMADYDAHGSRLISGTASFDIVRTVDGRIMFTAITPLWNDDYTIRNEVVAALDGVFDGEYYNEATQWIAQHSLLQS
jgi:hypothetical protein